MIYIYITGLRLQQNMLPKPLTKGITVRICLKSVKKKTLPNSCNFMSNIFVEKPEASSCFPSFCLIK